MGIGGEKFWFLWNPSESKRETKIGLKTHAGSSRNRSLRAKFGSSRGEARKIWIPLYLQFVSSNFLLYHEYFLVYITGNNTNLGCTMTGSDLGWLKYAAVEK